MIDDLVCRLCGTGGAEFFHADSNREYYRCTVCHLVFVPEKFWPSSTQERAVYDLHQNSEEDAGYRKFLSRLSDPLLHRLEPGGCGLDFGCGPGPLLFRLFQEQGYHVELFDPLYYNDLSLLQKRYDFITATEVVEHFREPRKEFELLFTMLKPGGWLGIMTKRVLNRQAFSKWHYIRDVTHLSFFCEETFCYLASHYDAELTVAGSDVVIFNKR